MVSPHLYKKFQRICANLRRGSEHKWGGGGFGPTPSPVATPLGGKEWEGRGADSVSCPRAHMTLATPLGCTNDWARLVNKWAGEIGRGAQMIGRDWWTNEQARLAGVHKWLGEIGEQMSRRDCQGARMIGVDTWNESHYTSVRTMQSWWFLSWNLWGRGGFVDSISEWSWTLTIVRLEIPFPFQFEQTTSTSEIHCLCQKLAQHFIWELHGIFWYLIRPGAFTISSAQDNSHHSPSTVGLRYTHSMVVLPVFETATKVTTLGHIWVDEVEQNWFPILIDTSVSML